MKKVIVLAGAAAVVFYAGGGHHAIPGTVAHATAPIVHGSNQAIANAMAASGYGWTGGQATCLDELWTHESGFDSTSLNNQSGAYGIPQSLPADKMASAGADWRTNPATQIKWGLGYIHDRYGSPCAAWSFEMSHSPNWY